MRCLRPGGVHSENPTIRSLALASWWPFQLINKAGMWEDGCVKCGPWLTADCLCGAGEQPKENFATADVPGKRCEFLVFLEPFHAKKKTNKKKIQYVCMYVCELFLFNIIQLLYIFQLLKVQLIEFNY